MIEIYDFDYERQLVNFVKDGNSINAEINIEDSANEIRQHIRHKKSAELSVYGKPVYTQSAMIDRASHWQEDKPNDGLYIESDGGYWVFL